MKHGVRLFFIRLCFVCMALCLPIMASAQKALTNDDVVKLSKLGLGEQTVIAKIRESSEVNFKLETDDLIKLKGAGVSGPIISAMLDRVTPQSSSAMRAAGLSNDASSLIKLVPSDGKAISLKSYVGQISSTYAFVTALIWLNFPNQHAAARTHDKQPHFLVATEQDPRSRYYIVRVEVNEKSDDRSLKVGKSGGFTMQSGGTPDPDWTIAFESVEQQRGAWTMTLKKPLPSGEYGVLSAQSRELFEFGVD